MTVGREYKGTIDLLSIGLLIVWGTISRSEVMVQPWSNEVVGVIFDVKSTIKPRGQRYHKRSIDFLPSISLAASLLRTTAELPSFTP